jgi:hypothetical protein
MAVITYSPLNKLTLRNTSLMIAIVLVEIRNEGSSNTTYRCTNLFCDKDILALRYARSMNKQYLPIACNW